MPRGSIIWRCRKCGTRTSGTCRHPKASYSIIYYLGSQQKWKAIGSKSRKDAERHLAEINAQIHQGMFVELKPISFSDFTEQWIRDYVQGAVKPLSLRFYRTLLKVHLCPEFGSSLLTQITPQHVQGFLASCLNEKSLSPKTVNSLLITLKSMLKHAKRWGYLRQSPAEFIKPVRVEHREMDYLTPDEIKLLLKNADEPYRTLFLTAILTGMRRGEILGLQWGDIDWGDGRIHVRRSLFWSTKDELNTSMHLDSWKFSAPKSERSIRTIIMSPKLKQALELHRLSCPVSKCDLVFCNKEGKPLDPNNLVKREFHPALSRAGLRKIRFHDMRHTFTALLIAQGAHAKFIQSQLGHASIETTLDRYGHLLPQLSQGTGEQLDSLVFGHQTPQAEFVTEELQI